MKLASLTIACILLLGIVSAAAQAAPTWCAANNPDSVFCEDWDRYCSDPPSDPNEACPPDSPRGGITKPWQSGHTGCSALTLEDAWLTTEPFSGRAPSKGDLGNSAIQLGGFIRNKFGVEYTRIMATEQSPIVFDFVIDSPPGKIGTSNIYVELAQSTAEPLTDYILSVNCNTTCGISVDPSTFPIICRQGPPAPTGLLGSCPPIATAPILPSIAAGAVSFLDTDPCHCGTSHNFASTANLSVFDGKQWWTLSNLNVPSVFPGYGNFRLHSRTAEGQPGPNKVRLTINHSTIKVELTYVTASNPSQEYSVCEVPRQYLGPFRVLNFGYAQPCQLRTNGLWECRTIRQCVNAKLGGTTTVDNMAINGGIGYEDPGACCITDLDGNPPSISCVQANGGMDCSLTYGGEYKGSNTTCEGVPCCPPFWPDHDMDGDVDLEDFGWFQTCLSYSQFADPPTVPCQCANLDGDLDVDTADFLIFADCLSGPGVPANSNCVN